MPLKTDLDEIKEIVLKISEKLQSELKKEWDGKESILYMKSNGSANWKQMEWIGFYFEFFCKNILDTIMEKKNIKYGNVEFDGFLKIPWDYKAHSENLGSKTPTNGLQEIKKALDEFGFIGFIIASGDSILEDDNQSFKKWHDELKGKKSKYVLEGISKGRSSRKRKEAFNLNKILFVIITKESLSKHGTFQEGMINSDGSPRNSKLLLDMNNLGADLIHTLKY